MQLNGWQARAHAWVESPQAHRTLRIAVGALTGFFILLFLYTALRRMHYPFDLEWVESGVLVSVGRLVQHRPLYAPPAIEYVPYLYAPLYFYVCAFVAKGTGLTFFTLRLVSTLSALGALGVLFAFVYRETRDGFAAIAAAGVFASLYAFIGAWFDIGRVDSLFLFLFLLAVFCTRFAPPLVAAAMWVLAFQTKQSALVIAIPFLLTYWERERKSRVAIALGGYAALAWASILWFNHLSSGWYSFYVFGATRGLPSVMRMAALYVPEVVLQPLSLAVVMILAAVLFAPPSLRSRATQFYLTGSATTFFAFWWVHAHRGVGNSMQVLYAWLAIVFGIALHRLLQRFAPHPNDARLSPHANCAAATTLLLIAVLAQMASQIYNPGQFIPSQQQLAAREALIAQVQQIPGPVYIVNHSFDDVLAGKQPFAEGEAVGAIVDAFPGKQRDNLIADLHQSASEHRFGAIVIDSDYKDWLKPETLAAYPVIVPAAGSDQPRFLTSQPKLVLLPCSAVADGTAQRIAPAGQAVNASACGPKANEALSAY